MFIIFFSFPTHPTFLFLRLKIKLKDHHFDTNKVVKEELQEILRSLKNTTSRMHLKNGRSAGNGACARKGTISRVMVASRPKDSF
jgi:DNA-directed RNA polymerase alpha subunit